MKSKLLIIFLLLSTTLSGCVTGKMMQSATKSYINQHVDVLINYVGMPSEERVIAGRRIISWHVSDKGVIPMTTPTSAYGTLYGNGAVFDLYITGSETTYHYYDYNCKLDAVVNERYRVLSIHWEGDQYGCSTFYSRLSKINKYNTTEHKTKKWKEERKEIMDKVREFKEAPEHVRKAQDKHEKKSKELESQVDNKMVICLEKAEKNTNNAADSNKYFEKCLSGSSVKTDEVINKPSPFESLVEDL